MRSIAVRGPASRDLRLSAAFLLIIAVGLVISRFLIDAAWLRIVLTITQFCLAFAVGPFVVLRLIATALEMLLHVTGVRADLLTDWVLRNLDAAIVYTLGLVATVLGAAILFIGILRLLYAI